MINILLPVPKFLGLLTHIDATQVPLGGAIVCKNLAQLNPGRLRRIPGMVQRATIAIDGSIRIPLGVFLWGSSFNLVMAVYQGASAAKIANLSGSAEITGPALGGGFLSRWTYTFYAQKHLLAGGGNSIQEITSSTTRIALAGTSVPVGDLIQSYRDRLYVSRIAAEEGIVRYSSALTTDFAANDLVNVKEIPGPVTALAINSPSTDVGGIDTQLIIFKKNAMWAWDETSKDEISRKIGTESLHTIKNTKVGLVFLGMNGSVNSIFLMRVGTAGEPMDIGEALFDILNGSNPLNAENRSIAAAELYSRFYRLHISRGTDTSNLTELWLDVDELARTGEIIWYGPHSRGGVDSTYEVDNGLHFNRRGLSGVVTWFHENPSADSGFINMDGATLSTELDMPLNVEPYNEEKIFDFFEIQVAKEANISGNAVSCEPIAEGVSQGTFSMNLYDDDLTGVARVAIPVRPAGEMGMVARDARIKLVHGTNARFDLLGASLQYLKHEGAGRVRS